MTSVTTPQDHRIATDAERAEVEARIARAAVPSWQHPPTIAERAAAAIKDGDDA